MLEEKYGSAQMHLLRSPLAVHQQKSSANSLPFLAIVHSLFPSANFGGNTGAEFHLKCVVVAGFHGGTHGGDVGI